MTNVQQGALVRSNRPAIALRVSDPSLYDRIEELSREQNISMNLAVNLLVGFAFNEIDKQKKTFVSKMVFESR